MGQISIWHWLLIIVASCAMGAIAAVITRWISGPFWKRWTAYSIISLVIIAVIAAVAV